MSEPGFSPNAHLLIGEMPAPAQLKSRWDVLTGGAIVPALVILIMVLFAMRTKTGQAIQQQVAEKLNVIFLEKKGPGGGGGGRPKDPAPPRKAEVVATKPVEIKPVPKPSVVPPTDLNIPVQTAQAVVTLPGALSQIDTSGIGVGGGGRGTGIGTGTGSGVGPGEGGGYGGGVYQIGNGVTSPVVIKEVKPNYTGDAMRAKVQGIVELEAVVLEDGTVDPSRIKITRSLDPHFGLDLEAIKAVKLWRFRPGTFQGRAVPVLVNIELTFTLR